MNPRDTFATTHWTRVLQARGDSSEARAALSDLCEAYYGPVLAFIRSWTRDPQRAQDLAHDFFAHLLSGKGFATLEKGPARFRSYLLGAVKHFIADRRQKDERLKRGGGAAHQSLEQDTDAVEFDEAGRTLPPSDAEFDRQWAFAILGRALDGVARDFHERGRASEFELLKPFLVGEAPALDACRLAECLGVSENAARVAVHRMRRRFREAIRREIRDTVRDPADSDEEMTYLLSAIAP